MPRKGPGRPRTTPDTLRADKAYSARATRALLRALGIKAVIPEPADQARHRKNRGSRGGRPVSYDREDYKGRNTIERAFNQLKSWRGVATRYDCEDLGRRSGPGLARDTTGPDGCLVLDLSTGVRSGTLAAAEPA